MSPVYKQCSTAVALVQLIATLMKCTAATLIGKKHFNSEPQCLGEHADHHHALLRYIIVNRMGKKKNKIY